MNSENSEAKKPQWFSIKEAAEYLDVGEPTMFRWMREGKITYRKVGDSTRFWQQDLDAVMEVFHSEKEISNVKAVCAFCHHDELVPGVFRTTGLNYFQPKKTKFWTLKDSNVETEARMCVRCGAVVLFGDTKKLAALKEENAISGAKKPTENEP
jgi:excisionase family DNA binding protein